MQAEIDRDLLEATPRHEGRDGVDVGHIAFHREPRGHADDVGFADALHEDAAGQFLPHAFNEIGTEIRSNVDHARIALGEFVHHVIAGRRHGRSRQPGTSSRSSHRS